MAVFKMCAFILCYFFARVAFSACEPYDRAGQKEVICWDETNKAMISEKCLKSVCDARKFLLQYKANKAKMKPSLGGSVASTACLELQLPIIMLKDSKNVLVPFCLFNDSSVLDATVVERLVL
jgi:hypothetical protein